MDDLAPDALALLVPFLGPLTDDPPEQVDGKNLNHPGQTFDYALRRPDGRRVAVEVTRAWDQEFLGAGMHWGAFVKQIEEETRRRHPGWVGRYAINVDPAYTGWPSDHDPEEFISAIEQCADAGQHRTVSIGRDVSVSNATAPREGQADLRIYSSFAAAEFELGEPARRRFAAAVARKHKTMTRAGDAGYETHLAVIHWVLGSTQAWREVLIETPPTALHPQQIWAIDLNATAGRPRGRVPVEKLRPGRRDLT